MELLSYTHPHKVLLSNIGLAVSIREDQINDVSYTIQARGTGFRRCQRKVPAKQLGRLVIDGWVARHQIIQYLMLIGCTGIIRQLLETALCHS
jgi:hypothetical protein